MRIKMLFLWLLCFFTTSVFAWGSVGHRLVAQIAYDQLTPQAKKQIDALTDVMFHSRYPDARFARASTWPDTIRQQAPQYSPWHFISLPIVKDNVTPPALENNNNVVWAIARAEKIVSDPSENNARRAKYLSFLVHFIGDIHQPLHCATLYDHQFLHGDRGGNDFPIASSVSNNLHWFWDEGVGLFASNPGQYQFHYYEIQTMANQWMKDYPRAYFTKQLQEQSPMQWAKDSHHIANTVVYQIQPNTKPSQTYIQNGQTIVREQVVLAGYRLADVLNRIFG
ncbi:MAG: hypothetical protein A3F13_06205 [Gammaproteobacteria bacterium RIFCSPHIGHO2_12_FULL_40_19]|nr:MAG: hypothetical protein A3F13_06205 [Gammaproteobacteria bacterium RIFCSPHIGHO2_12_FULL_40_19]